MSDEKENTCQKSFKMRSPTEYIPLRCKIKYARFVTTWCKDYGNRSTVPALSFAHSSIRPRRGRTNIVQENFASDSVKCLRGIDSSFSYR
ncbi:hypothetical protein NPIL_176461 [Nephila pilipes]|uniref:Uncharacterized protein n=1 Tax=Nephila pilipes TaxID=299642 RepID=A0A8X6PI13_NEPPI|nr:hypothetical protein NPIL_176461 [Nephila pilipes]